MNRPKGSLILPLALILAFSSIAALGLVDLIFMERKKIETQFQLDRCVGSLAIEFGDILNQIEKSNSWMSKLRWGASPGELLGIIPPGVREQGQKGIVYYQEALHIKWLSTLISWMIPGSCMDGGDIPYFSQDPWPMHRPEPDLLGENGLEWDDSKEMRFVIGRIKGLQNSFAEVAYDEEDPRFPGNEEWHSTWTTRASFN